MKEKIKKILLKLNLLNIARRCDLFKYLKYKANHKKKQDVLLFLKKKFSIDLLIETGTYLGDMVSAMKDHFKQIYSIELGEDLYNNAVNRFRNNKNITILNGDSGNLLPELLSKINEPCLFWLDAHYSVGVTAKGDMETPIIKELDIILSHEIKKHVIAIDDASSFLGENGYPTIETLKKEVLSKNSSYQIEIIDNIIEIYPANITK